MNTSTEGKDMLETALESFCDSLPSSLYEESSHVKVFSVYSKLPIGSLQRSFHPEFEMKHSSCIYGKKVK